MEARTKPRLVMRMNFVFFKATLKSWGHSDAKNYYESNNASHLTNADRWATEKVRTSTETICFVN